MLGSLNSRKRPPAGSELVRDVVRTPRPTNQPRRVWRLSDPNALQRLTGRVAQPTPTPIPWIDSDEHMVQSVQSLVRELPDLSASVPDTDDLAATRQLPIVSAVPTPTPTPPIAMVRHADVRARFEAIPDLNQLVQGEVDARARLQRDVEAALQEAVAKLQPELGKKPTSPVAWLLLGLSLGGMLVFFMMGANHVQSAQPVAMTMGTTNPPAAAPPPVCVAPEIAPLSTITTTSVDALPMPIIPTFTVDALPKPKPKAVWSAPRRTVTPASTATASAPAIEETSDSDNPYDDVKAEEAAQ